MIALIGTGYWGKNLLRVFNQLGVLSMVCDLDEEILKQKKQEYPNIEITTDFSRVLKDKNIKAVVIAAPAASHYELVKKAFESGKDVFVEKPLALNVDQGEELVRIAEEKSLILMVGHLLHYHPGVNKLKEMIKGGELGQIRYIWSNRLNFGKMRSKENVFLSLASHDISLIINILGMPKKMSALGKAYLQDNIPDTVLNFLEFRENQAAHIFVSWLNPFKEQKFCVIGSEKMVVFDGVKNELIVYAHQIKWNNNKNPEAIKAEPQLIKIPDKEPLIQEAEHFLECIKQRKKPITDGKEALSVLKILDSCQKLLL